MKKVLISILLFIVLMNIKVNASVTDISGHWAYEEINSFINNEYINGYDNNTFCPDNNIKIDEFLKIIALTIDRRIVKSNDEWSKPYINFCIENNIIKKGIYNYQELLTRKDAINIIYEYLKFYEIATISFQKENIEFEDEDDISNSLKTLYYAHIVNGYEDGTIRLSRNITRAEVICLVNRLIKYRDDLIYSKDFNIYAYDKEELPIYTNYLGSGELAYYTIKNNEVIYTDLGKYSYYEKVKTKFSEIVVSGINILANRENYVFTTYLNDSNCVYIAYGANKEYISNGSVLWDIYLYDQAKKINDFEYSTRISVYRLWKYLDEIKNNKNNIHYVNKLEKILNLFLEGETSKQVIKHIEKGGNSEKIGNVYIQKVSDNFLIYI